jgi:hypothetical protein
MIEVKEFFKFLKEIMTAKNIYLLFLFLLYSIIPIALIWLGNKSIVNLGVSGIIFFSVIMFLPIILILMSISYIVLKNISVRENTENPLEFDVRYEDKKQLFLTGSIGGIIIGLATLTTCKILDLNFTIFYIILLSFLCLRLLFSFLYRKKYRQKRQTN